MSDTTHASEISPYHFIYLLIAVINDLLWRVLEVIKVSVDMINYGNAFENFTQTSPSEVIIASIVPICGRVSIGTLGLARQKRQTFVNNHIECWVTELQVPDIHLMPYRKGCYRELELRKKCVHSIFGLDSECLCLICSIQIEEYYRGSVSVMFSRFI